MSATIHDAREQRFGRYLDDYIVGDIYKHWPGKTVTEADNHLFCLLTLAASPVHIDRAYASSDMASGRNMVAGTYVYSLLLGMSVPDISGKAIANLGLENLRHIKPVFHGDTIYGETEILSTRLSLTRPEQGILTVRTDGFNQDGIKVCVFTRPVLLPLRGANGEQDE